MKKILTFALILSLLALPLSLASCSNKDKNSFDTKNCYKTALPTTDGETNFVQIQICDDAYIVVELYPDVAPLTVANFKKLVKEDFYDGIIFHRVISGFMIQGGDPLGTGMGGSDETIKGEFLSNGVKNDLSHERGVISMARKGNDNNSASSQFFIMHKDSPSLDGDYAAFGRVVAGMETVDAIAAVSTNTNDKPLVNVTITSMEFVEYTPSK